MARARITYIADDWREVRIKLPLNWRTRNYVGTIFGGSMYGAVDPIYMVMLIRILGPTYVVWDKGATLQFKQPGRSTLHACFVLDAAEIDAVQAEAHGTPGGRAQLPGRSGRRGRCDPRDGHADAAHPAQGSRSLIRRARADDRGAHLHRGHPPLIPVS